MSLSRHCCTTKKRCKLQVIAGVSCFINYFNYVTVKEKYMPKNSDSKLSALEQYKVAIDTRNLEIGLFWQRSNYFLVLNAALALGFFKVEEGKFSVLLAVFGIFVSIIWFRVNLGSKFWQSRWEQRLKLKEEEIASDLNYYSADWDLIYKDVKDNLEYSSKNNGWVRRWIDRETLNKPSVSYNMILLSIIFQIGWILLVVLEFITSS